MGGVLGDADRTLDVVAAGETGAVVAQEPVAVGERGLVHQRLGPGGAQTPADQDDRLPRSPQVVFQLDALDGRACHPMRDDFIHRNRSIIAVMN